VSCDPFNCVRSHENTTETAGLGKPAGPGTHMVEDAHPQQPRGRAGQGRTCDPASRLLGPAWPSPTVSVSRSAGRDGHRALVRTELHELVASQSPLSRCNLIRALRGVCTEPGESCRLTWLRQTQTPLPTGGLRIKKLFLPG